MTTHGSTTHEPHGLRPLARRLLTTGLLAASLAGPLAAQQPTAEELFYKAFYQESGLRDFPAAAEAYAAVLARPELPADLRARALAGRARALAMLGQGDAAEAAWRAVLELAPTDEEARTALARSQSASPDERLDAEIRANVERLGRDPQAQSNLVRFGSRAVPELARILRGKPEGAGPPTAVFVLSELARRGDEVAIAALARWIGEAPLPAILAPHALEAILTGPLSLDALAVYRALLEDPSVDVRRRTAEFVARAAQSLEKPGGPLLLARHEDELLPLLERAARDESYLVRGVLLMQLGHPRTASALPPRATRMALDLIERSMASTLPGEREEARTTALAYREAFRAHGDELLPLVSSESSPLRISTHEWTTNALAEGWLTTAQAVRLLARPDDPATHLTVWRWLLERLGQPEGPTVADLRPYALEIAREWLAGREQFQSLELPFTDSFGPFEFGWEQHLALWESTQGIRTRRNFGFPLRELLTGMLRGVTTPAEADERVRAVHGRVGDALTAVWLGDLEQLDIVLPAFHALQELASADDPNVRGRAYVALSTLLAKGAEGPERWTLPRLLDDIDQVPGASTLFGELADPSFAAQLEVRLSTLTEPAERGRLLGALAGMGDPAQISARYAQLAPGGTPDVDLARAFHQGLLQCPRSDDRAVLEALVALARDQAPLRAALVAETRTGSWPWDLLTELTTSALTDPQEAGWVVNRALGLVAGRGLGVPLERLLPYLRSSDGGVRTAAQEAAESVRRARDFERAAVGFGDDARRRAVESIRAGVASPDAARRRAAAYAIAALGDPDGVGLLLDLVGDADAGVRAAAVAALEKMGTSGGE